MSRVLKSTSFTVDQDNRVTIETTKIGSVENNTNQNDTNAEHDAKYIEELKSKASDIIAKANEEALKITQDATNKAEQIINEANDSKDAIVNEFKDIGFNEGKEEGYNEGLQVAESIKADAQQILDESIIKRENLANELEIEIIELVDKIISDFLNNSFELNKSLLKHLIVRGLSNATIINEVTIKVSEEDFEEVSSQKLELLKLLDSSKKMEIVKDYTLDATQCIIETEYGNIECGLEQQYKTLKENLFYILNNR